MEVDIILIAFENTLLKIKNQEILDLISYNKPLSNNKYSIENSFFEVHYNYQIVDNSFKYNEKLQLKNISQKNNQYRFE